MTKYIFAFIITATTFTSPQQARADLWGGDLPLLAKIVFNTLQTMYELRRQSEYMSDELAGIKDRIDRIRTISELVQPSTWDQWKNPQEALRRLQAIYQTMPKEYRSEKSDVIEAEITKAMNLIARISGEAQTTFKSGKELERRGADASPGVAQKLTASGVGTLVSLESQTLTLQSHITSLLTQMLADANERETRAVVSRGAGFSGVAKELTTQERTFSRVALAKGREE